MRIENLIILPATALTKTARAAFYSVRLIFGQGGS